MATHYETLGVPKTSTTEEIRRAYHVQARRWHPDRAGDRSPAEARRAEDAMRSVNEAWRVLSDDRRRREYDRALDLGAVTNGSGPASPTATEPPGAPRIDPRLLDPEYLAARRRAQVEHIERGHAAVLRSLPWLAVLGFLLAIVIFSAYQGSPGGDEGDQAGVLPDRATVPASEPVPLPSIGVPAGSCVRVLSGPSLQEVPCGGPRDGVVVGVTLDPEAGCPLPADQEVTLRNGAIVCLAP